MLDKDFKAIIENIKNEIYRTQISIMSDANKRLIELYYNVGKFVSENASWGSKFIDSLEREIKIDFPNIKGFSARNIRNMQKFYEEYSEDEIWQLPVAKLPWTHNNVLISKVKDKNIRMWYLEKAIEENWSKVILEHQIDSDLYGRQAMVEKSNNFFRELPTPHSDLANDLQKDPYIFDLPFLKDKYLETELENALVERIKDTLLELGKGFSFVGNQYKVTDGETDYFIDMLFYHLELRCYIVVELKTEKFKPEYTGQLAFYMSAIDNTLRKEVDNPTIGLLLCKEKNKLSVEWALDKINAPIGVSGYEIKKILPKEMLDSLPTEEELNLHIDIDEME